MIDINFRENHFSYIIIDEASQATEPEILIPLAITNKNSEDDGVRFQAQIVIAGDPHQLGPVVRCKRIEHLLGKFIIYIIFFLMILNVIKCIICILQFLDFI